MLTHNCTSIFLQQQQHGDDEWRVVTSIQWSCQPVSLVSAYPYILAMSVDNLEVRSQVNGTLLQILNLPKLKCLSTKVRRTSSIKMGKFLAAPLNYIEHYSN